MLFHRIYRRVEDCPYILKPAVVDFIEFAQKANIELQMRKSGSRRLHIINKALTNAGYVRNGDHNSCHKERVGEMEFNPKSTSVIRRETHLLLWRDKTVEGAGDLVGCDVPKNQKIFFSMKSLNSLLNLSMLNLSAFFLISQGSKRVFCR